MLQLKSVNYQIADFNLLKNIEWVINPGKKVALIGANGAGKTTLFRIINGELKKSSGEIIKPKGFRIGYLPQEEIAVGSGAIVHNVLEGHKEAFNIESEIEAIHASLEDASSSEKEKLLMNLGDLEQRFQLIGGYELESQAKKILAGLGFSEHEFYRPLEEFSGGWRMRVYLAKLLLKDPDLLLLDEPTNHLDLESLEWLEDYLKYFKGSMIMISHDRYFIDRLADEIAEIENGRLTHYPGNYHYYENQKSIIREQLIKKAEEIQQEKERLNRFINRFRYKATKAAQVQSRVKMLEKLDEVELPAKQYFLHFRIECAVKSFHDVCHFNKVFFSYDKKAVLRGINFQIYRGDKIALVGQNGAGKTTLTKLITGQLKPVSGHVKTGERVHFGYYAQHQIDILDLNKTAYQEVLETAADDKHTRVRDVLGLFGISGDQVDKKIKILSGGEKARVSLAKILLSPVNFLIMDEPTNHLDVMSKDALENALHYFDGTILVISHDRYFLDKIVGRVFELKAGMLRQFEGNYTDYLYRKRETQPEKQVPEIPLKEDKARKSKDRKRYEAELRQSVSKERKKLETEIKNVELKIAELESEKLDIENAMGDPEFYKDEQRSAAGNRRYQEINNELPRLYNLWEINQQNLEKLLNSLGKKNNFG